MRFDSSEAFLGQDRKCITLMGMSNIGKTRLVSKLSPGEWFQYGIDYRLATKYLREPIIDSIKTRMMRDPVLAAHLRDDSVSVDLNVTFTNLNMVSRYLGKLGDPDKGGLSPEDFLLRQALHRKAEISAVLDMPEFILRARTIYGYPHFIADASGSLCEIIDPEDDTDPVLNVILDHSLLVYLRPDDEHEATLVNQAREHPKPLYYRPEFLRDSIAAYLADNKMEAVETINPDDFVRWVFPRLLAIRRPRYERIARHGYVVSATDAAMVRDQKDFLALVCRAIDQHTVTTGYSGTLSWLPGLPNDGRGLQCPVAAQHSLLDRLDG